MRIEKLEQDRIKVTLSYSDLADMNINAEMLTANSMEINTFLVEIMEIIKAETGFCTENAQTVIEAIPEKDGVVLLVSKIKKLSKPKIRGVRAAKKDECCIFEFNSFDDVCLNDMRLYRYKSRFYIAVSRRNAATLMYEYSERCRRFSIAEVRMQEYAELLAKGTDLVKIASIAKKLK